ncbi:MAG: antibiotic biosynthesis monooxygenase [Candidatus Pacebacteria bacterium]|nr:antibiotic biosynthesis monooxygenase [Candidatus Paceibacterota bacterium]
MKRLIVTYSVHPDKRQDFIEASEKFVSQIEELESGMLECTTCQGCDENSFVHYLSFKDDGARKAHEKAHHTQIFMTLIKNFCMGEITHIPLADKGVPTGITPSSPDEEYRQQREVDLHKNQEDIDRIKGSESL